MVVLCQKITLRVLCHLEAIGPTQAQHAAFSDEALVKVIAVSESPRPEKRNPYMFAAPDASQENMKKPMKAPMKMQTRIYPL